MDAVIESGQFDAMSIVHFNMCLLFLQALSLSDIVTSDGTMIEYDYFQGRRIDSRPRHIKWPRQERPPPRCWRIWRNVITTLWSDLR